MHGGAVAAEKANKSRTFGANKKGGARRKADGSAPKLTGNVGTLARERQLRGLINESNKYVILV